MSTLNLDKGDIRNLKAIFDIFWPEMIKGLADDKELDNIEYLRSLVRINDSLEQEVKKNNEENTYILR